jgi:hypothetical protein
MNIFIIPEKINIVYLHNIIFCRVKNKKLTYKLSNKNLKIF